MKVSRSKWMIFAVVVPCLAARGEGPKNAYCDDVDYQMMSPPSVPPSEIGRLNLLGENEKKDPDAARKLAVQPGAYGHSELGIRYLSRLLGYKGEFDEPKAAENWIRDIDDPKLKSALWSLWQKWVVHAAKRFEAPGGSASALKDPGGSFFLSESDRRDYARCVRNDLARALCESSAHDRIRPGDRVYYSGGSFEKTLKQGRYCKISWAQRPLHDLPPKTEHIKEVTTMKKTDLEGNVLWEKTLTNEWDRTNALQDQPPPSTSQQAPTDAKTAK